MSGVLLGANTDEPLNKPVGQSKLVELKKTHYFYVLTITQHQTSTYMLIKYVHPAIDLKLDGLLG